MAKLASTQLEQLREIGAYLRQVRQQQGRTLDDIANQIFIRPALLRGIEEAQDQHLPEPVFVQGFIRRYADVLGLDGTALSKEFSVTAVNAFSEPFPKGANGQGGNGHGVHGNSANGNGSSSYGEAALPQPAPEPRQPSPEPRQPLAEPRQPIAFPAESPVPERRASRRQEGFPLGLIVGALVLAGAIGWGLWSLANRTDAPVAGSSSNSAAGTPETASDPVLLPETEAEPEPVLSAPVVADVSLRERAWISVVADGQTVYEGILERGAEETYEAQTSLRITSGNAGGVDLSFNGNNPITMGAPGAVRTLTLTPDTDPANLETP